MARQKRPAILERLFPARDKDAERLMDALGRCEDGDPEAMRAVLAATGRLVAPHDVRAAAGGIGEQAFAELLFDPPLDAVGPVSDDEVHQLVAALLAGKLSEADTDRALDLAGRAWLESKGNGVAEVFGDDDALRARWNR